MPREAVLPSKWSIAMTLVSDIAVAEGNGPGVRAFYEEIDQRHVAERYGRLWKPLRANRYGDIIGVIGLDRELTDCAESSWQGKAI